MSTTDPSPESSLWGRLRRVPRMPVLSRFEQLDDVGATEEQVVELREARVVFLDYALLQHDFPQLADLRPEREDHRARIDAWVLRHGAFISRAQAAQTDVNTRIAAGPRCVPAMRPSRYGRAVVVRTDEGPGHALLDIKGAGVGPGRTPSVLLHRSGLMQLGEIFQDLARQWLLDAVFGHARARFHTLPCYGVLDPGFDARTVAGALVPAGLQLRRAHRRPYLGIELPFPGSPEEGLKIEVEMLARRYGLSSCNNGTLLELEDDPRGRLRSKYGEHHEQLHADPEGPREAFIRNVCRMPRSGSGMRRFFECINVQLTRSDPGFEPVLVDFGHWTWRDRFHHPVVSLVQGRPLGWGGALWPEDAAFVQPYAALRGAFEAWSGDHAWALARGFRDGTLTGPSIRRQIIELVDHVLGRLSSDSQSRS